MGTARGTTFLGRNKLRIIFLRNFSLSSINSKIDIENFVKESLYVNFYKYSHIFIIYFLEIQWIYYIYLDSLTDPLVAKQSILHPFSLFHFTRKKIYKLYLNL